MRLAWSSFVVFGMASSALAQSRDPAGAEKLYADGEKLRDAGDWAAACAKFEGSQVLDPAAGTALQLVACAEREGKLATAWLRLKEARSLNADTKSERTRSEIDAFIQAATARIEPMMPMLRIDVSGPEKAVIMRNGQPVVEGAELPVDPGKHTIVVSAQGFVDVRRELELGAAQRETLTIELVPVPATGPTESSPTAPAVSPPAKAQAADGLSAIQVGGIVVAGVGGASLITSLALGIVALDKESKLEAFGCDARGEALACDPSSFDEAQQLSSDGATLATVSTVTTFVGAAAVGAGVLMLALGGGSAEETVAIVPWAGQGRAGLLVGGRFQ